MARDRQTIPTDTDVRSARDYREYRIRRGPHRLYARDYPGEEPAIVLLHGFPDDLHRFFPDPHVRAEFLPLLYQQFEASPSAHEAFFGLNQDPLATVASGTAALPRVRQFTRPLRIIFGATDPYLNAAVARRFHELFPTSELFLLPDARHLRADGRATAGRPADHGDPRQRIAPDSPKSVPARSQAQVDRGAGSVRGRQPFATVSRRCRVGAVPRSPTLRRLGGMEIVVALLALAGAWSEWWRERARIAGRTC